MVFVAEQQGIKTLTDDNVLDGPSEHTL